MIAMAAMAAMALMAAPLMTFAGHCDSADNLYSIKFCWGHVIALKFVNGCDGCNNVD